MLRKYVENSSDICPDGERLEFTLIGSTIGTHIGPGAIAVVFLQKNKSIARLRTKLGLNIFLYFAIID